ncbi:hypothetical protein F5Y12DRAFT_160654 [Xylaria sp. FL1777]|nr:hypothetical protein F5Y12DRAFT_160654 [Xylaria sp. FL1777]
MDASQVTMNLGGDETYEIAVSYGTIIGTGGLAIVVCGARLLTRATVIRAFGIDDWACLVALTFTTTFSALGVAAVANGAGRHINHVLPSELALWFKFYYACTCLSLVTAFAVKTSLLLYLRRLFPTPFLKRYIPIFLIFMFLITFAFGFVDAFQCNPPHYIYDLKYVMDPDRVNHCLPADTVYGVFLFQAILLFIIDIIILVLPVPIIWSLKLQHGKGILALLIFVPAIVACIAPTLRFSSLAFLKSQDTDITYHSASALYWQCIEYNLGMIAGSVGCLSPLFKRLGTIGKKHLTNPKLSSSSYRLDDRNDWSPKKGSGNRVQGDSVLYTARPQEYGDSDEYFAHGSERHLAA